MFRYGACYLSDQVDAVTEAPTYKGNSHSASSFQSPPPPNSGLKTPTLLLLSILTFL